MLSDDLAAYYSEYINSMGMVDSNGIELTLEESDSGIYLKGVCAFDDLYAMKPENNLFGNDENQNVLS